MAERTKLIQARKHKGWTQKQAAAFIGMSERAYREWEQGDAIPRLSSIQQLCAAFEASPEALGLDPVAETNAATPHPDLEIMIGSDLTLRLMAVVFTPHRTYQIKQNSLIALIEEDASMQKESLPRREALRRIATLPLLTLSLSPLPVVSLQHPPEEIINQCASGITACWELSKGDDESDLHLAMKGVSSYLPTLKAMVSEQARYRKDAASLAAQCALLQCLLGWHLQGLPEAIAYAEEAVAYAKEASDIPLLLSALDYLAWAHYYSKHNKTALKMISQAIPYLKQQKAPLSPHLLGGVYSTIALMQAKNGVAGTEILHQAAESFFAQSETDDRFVYMDYTRADLVLNNGMVHYYQGDQVQAMESLGQLIDADNLSLKYPLPERSRIEGINTMALATLKTKKKDREKTLHFLKAGMIGATKLQSEQRYSEAMLAYEIADAVWPGDIHVKELRELATHW